MEHLDLIKKLKEKRKELALREGKELFMILSNATIEEMCRVLPQTKDELILIKGWGEKKIKMYGESFLEIISQAPVQSHFETLQTFESSPPKKISIQIGEEVKPLETISTTEEKDASPSDGIMSVSEFLGNINTTLAEFGVVKIRGEIDEVQIRNGYAFFTLKESIGGFTSESALGCFVNWRSLDTLEHLLQNGIEVVITGYPKVYLKNGSFRLEVTNIDPVGEGALQKAFEALKRKLGDKKGYFDEARKRSIPLFIQKIGLITSMNGAVIEDFKKNIGSWGFQIECFDVRVEGDFAEENIIRAVRYFNEHSKDIDVLVLIRGGGSLQSFQAFNSERVADTLYSSRIPIITGIGHDKDETIAGFVSDLNCSTPTAVANFLRAQKENLIYKVDTLSREMVSHFYQNISEEKNNLTHTTQSLVFSIQNTMKKEKNKVDIIHERLRFGLQRIFIGFQNTEKFFVQSAMHFYKLISETSFHVKIYTEKIIHHSYLKLQDTKQKLQFFDEKISYLNPEALLKKGYSITYDEKGHILKDISYIKNGEKIRTRITTGNIVSVIEKLEK